jgi:hypothetical protein
MPVAALLMYIQSPRKLKFSFLVRAYLMTVKREVSFNGAGTKRQVLPLRREH